MKDSSHERDPFRRPFGSLENLADKISDVLACPVTIEDANHRLLAYSMHEDSTDSARIATIISRKVPEKVINALWKARVIPELMKSGEPLRVPEIKEIGLGDRVAIAIRNQHEVLGYIWIVEEKEQLTAGKMQLLKLAAQSARTELLKLHVQKKKRVESYQDFFWQLLTGRYQNHQEIKDKMEDLHIKPPSPFAVLVFHFEEEVTEKTEEKIIYLITTSQKVNITLHGAMGQEFILLATPPAGQLSENSIVDFLSFFIDQMKTRFQIGGITGSSGSLYNSYDRIEASYQEALDVLRLKEQFTVEMNDIFSYKQLGVFRYLEVLLEKKQRDRYEHPALEKLAKYDAEHKTAMMETLECFINLDSNVNETAKKLHIHVNTLNYRLKRIAEIGEIDLKNANQKVTLFLEFKIKRIESVKHRL